LNKLTADLEAQEKTNVVNPIIKNLDDENIPSADSAGTGGSGSRDLVIESEMLSRTSTR
jgi:hypothetical protein